MDCCPGCHAEITSADADANVCTQCGQDLTPLTLEELLTQIGANQKCMDVVKKAFEPKKEAK